MKQITFWKSVENKFKYPTKRYVLIFNKWQITPRTNLSISEFDSKEEVAEEISLLNKFYHDTPRPEKIKDKAWRSWDKRYTYSYKNGGWWWGYIVLDFKDEKCLEIGHDGFGSYKRMKDFDLYAKDYFFRKNDEIPIDYNFDEGEYEGWIQFRWGDGKNAIGYVEPEVEKKERPGVDEYWEVYDEATDSYRRKKVRVVYVDWDEPLPKKEKGIKYMRPNKEPVLFPGDFGYKSDLNISEWSLAEEIAGDEYLDKNGKRRFEIEEPTTSSIGDMLGDDNPLLKLKFDD